MTQKDEQFWDMMALVTINMGISISKNGTILSIPENIDFPRRKVSGSVRTRVIDIIFGSLISCESKIYCASTAAEGINANL